MAIDKLLSSFEVSWVADMKPLAPPIRQSPHDYVYIQLPIDSPFLTLQPLPTSVPFPILEPIQLPAPASTTSLITLPVLDPVRPPPTSNSLFSLFPYDSCFDIQSLVYSVPESVYTIPENILAYGRDDTYDEYSPTISSGEGDKDRIHDSNETQYPNSQNNHSENKNINET